jgi:porphobilinogen deaminase
VWAEISDQTLTLTSVLLSHDGTTRLEQSVSGSSDDPEHIGVSLAEKLFEAGASVLLGE